MVKNNLFTLIVLCLGIPLMAQEIPSKAMFSLRGENDALSVLGPKTDYWYSNGTFLSYTWKTNKEPSVLSAFPFLRNKQTEDVFLDFRLNHQIYTPKDLRSAQNIAEDHPYAGILTSTLCLKSYSSLVGVSTALSLELGVVGPMAGGEHIQKRLHELIDAPIPQGWHNQLANKPLLNVNYRIDKRLFTKKRYTEFIGFALGGVGNKHTFIGSGVLARIGKTRSYFEGPIYQNIGNKNSTKRSWSFFLETSIQAEYSIYTVLEPYSNLEFSYKSDPFRVNGSLGLQIGLNNISMRYAQNVQHMFNTEYKHQYGTISFFVGI